jgi:hypothetical protein
MIPENENYCNYRIERLKNFLRNKKKRTLDPET